jgi:hypothetical protein
VRCPFCGSSLVLDLDGVRPHLMYQPERPADDAVPLLRHWCDTRDLPLPSSLSAPQLIYRPFWLFLDAGAPRLIPAWPTIEPRWSLVSVPEGARVVFDPAGVASAGVLEPAIAEAAARPEGGAPGALVHVPFYDLEGSLDGAQAGYSIEACSGRVYPERLPAASRRPARWGGAATAAAPGFLLMFLEAALIPHAWLAAITVAATGWVVCWAMREREA